MKSGVFTPQPVSASPTSAEDIPSLRQFRWQAGYFVLSRYHFGLQHKAPKVKRERPVEFELCITSMLFVFLLIIVCLDTDKLNLPTFF